MNTRESYVNTGEFVVTPGGFVVNSGGFVWKFGEFDAFSNAIQVQGKSLSVFI